ncbi:alpha-hydroxy acid oxidase [Streptomyces sp. NPDC058398]|uniref:alpha-hydroxy acid oxidase n=1 Tax=Streptomyces sp. NPDC058398 TaxID=3346479 RepID=UPI003667E18D
MREIRELVRPRPPRLGRSAVLDRCHDVDDLRAAARRRLPRAVFDYVDGGADEEIALAANRDAFRRVRFSPRVLRDVSAPDLATHLFGTQIRAPLGLAPTGYTRMIHPGAEPAVARAATARGLPYALSTVATTALEDVAATGHTNLWFQLYVLKDRALTHALVGRAETAGFQVLEVALDTAVAGHRTRDVRNGLTIPPRLALSTLLDIGTRPGYWTSVLRGAPLTLANLQTARAPGQSGTVAVLNDLFDPAVTWDDIAELRARWPGALVLKGPLAPADVRRAVEVGADGVHLSNHGGRQLDRCVSPLHLLRPAREAAGDRLALVLDSGVRHGADIAAALALGADLCMIGRPYLYGAAVAGQAGVERAIDLLVTQLRRTLQLLGVTDLTELRKLGPELVTLPPPTGSHRPAEQEGGHV